MAPYQHGIRSVLLAYSGGLDTSAALRWIKDQYHCDVYCLLVDVGQSEDFTEIKSRALYAGAKDVFIEDTRNEFAKDFIFPMLQAHPTYEGQYLLGSAISRPAIAKVQVELAAKLKVDALAHGSTGKGNDQFRFELGYAALGSGLPVIAPWRIWPFRSRADLISYSNSHHIPLAPDTKAHKPLSMDRNLVHTSYEGEALEDPSKPAPVQAFDRITDIHKAPDKAETFRIEFAEGIPTAINGQELSPLQIMEKLNDMGSRHGIGRVDHVESRFLGMKSRNVYETPGLTILYAAHRAAEAMCLDREVLYLKEILMPVYAKMIYNGLWYSPERKMLQAAFDSVSHDVNARIGFSLYKGNIAILDRQALQSLYDVKLSSLEEDADFQHSDAAGFIKLSAMRLRQAGARGSPQVDVEKKWTSRQSRGLVAS